MGRHAHSADLTGVNDAGHRGSIIARGNALPRDPPPILADMPARPRRPPKQRPPDPDRVGATRRLFLAVPLPDPLRHHITTLIDSLAAEGWPIRWVNPVGAHLTLHFLGETAPEHGELLRLGLSGTVGRHARFDLESAQLGVFPGLDRPRILWLGLTGPLQKLVNLRDDLVSPLHQLGFAIERGPFRPHITLGRVRDGAPPDLPVAIQKRLAIEAMESLSAIALPVAEVVLYQSMLSSDGARYVALARFPLAADAPRHDG